MDGRARVSMNTDWNFDIDKNPSNFNFIDEPTEKKQLKMPFHSSTANDSNFSTETFTAADNQTEIIYTVFVNGLPVLASIAANDMKLMSDAEVANILDKPVFTKAERMGSHNFSIAL